MPPLRCGGLQRALEAAAQADHVPGAVAARFSATEVDEAAAGVAAPGEPMSVDHGVAWFSVTKLVTMTAALRAVEAGALTLDAPVARWLPELATADRPTLRDLLAHRAGLPDPIPWGWLQPAPAPRRADRGLAALARSAPSWWRGDPVEAPARYSNLSYAAVGEVLRRALQRPLVEILASTTEALGLTATGFEPGGRAAAGHVPYGAPFDLAMWLAGARAVSRGRRGRWRVLDPVRMDVPAAGGAFGPVGDLARFGQRWLTGQGLGLSTALWRAALTEPGPYALGFARGDRGRLVHEGSGLGFVARLELDLDAGRGWAVLVNRSGRWRPEWGGLERLAAEVRRAPVDRAA